MDACEAPKEENQTLLDPLNNLEADDPSEIYTLTYDCNTFHGLFLGMPLGYDNPHTNELVALGGYFDCEGDLWVFEEPSADVAKKIMDMGYHLVVYYRYRVAP